MKIEFLDNEYWYGLCVVDGCNFPLDKNSEYTYDGIDFTRANQSSPLLISSKGRYIFSEKPFSLIAKNGVFTIEGEDVRLYDGFKTLKGAQLEAINKHYKPTGQIPCENFFRKPQYNTWIELLYDQTEEAILNYAENILKNGLPAGIIMIDDGWQAYYGSTEFANQFGDPKRMNEKLHKMGFETMLWTSPFISPDSPTYRHLMWKGYLIKDKTGEPAIRRWWNGCSAIIDLSNPEGKKWFKEEYLGKLLDLGFDGFKFDAGDSYDYLDDDINYGGLKPYEQCKEWSLLALEYKYNELRASYNAGGLPLVQRLCDKPHKWESVGNLITDILTQGIIGYFYGCPDMIGGGWVCDFPKGSRAKSEELFVRYAQAAALMPMMQYSAAPWRVLNEENARLCLDAGKTHSSFADTIIALAKNSAKTGEPIVRYMEYEFPNQGYEKIVDQFMLGSDILVAPVIKEHQYKREVVLPNGQWQYVNGEIYEGGKAVEVDAPLDTLPYFIRKN